MKDIFKRKSFPGRFDWWREFGHDFRVGLRRRARRRLRHGLRLAFRSYSRGDSLVDESDEARDVTLGTVASEVDAQVEPAAT